MDIMRTFVLVVVSFAVLISPRLCAQVGIGTTNPHPSAILDIVSSSKGVLIPRLEASEILSIGTPAEGLLVYANTTAGSIDSIGFWYYHNGAWLSLSGSGSDLWKRNNDGEVVATNVAAPNLFRIIPDGSIIGSFTDPNGDVKSYSFGGGFSDNSLNSQTNRYGYINNYLEHSSQTNPALKNFSIQENSMTLRGTDHEDLRGVSNLIEFSDSGGGVTADVVSGSRNELRLFNANVSKAIVVDAIIELGSSSSVQNAYLFYGDMDAISPTGSLSNAYGLFLDDINSGVSGNYAIYTNDGIVSFGDDLRIRNNATIEASSLNLEGLPEFNDDVSAGGGGLLPGDVYRTTNGLLRVKL